MLEIKKIIFLYLKCVRRRKKVIDSNLLKTKYMFNDNQYK